MLSRHGGRSSPRKNSAFVTGFYEFRPSRKLGASSRRFRLPEMVAQVRRGVAFVHRAASFGGDPGQIYLLGHSSAYSIGAALAGPWPGPAQQAASCAARSASGSYDLEPVLLSHRGSYLKLDAAEAREPLPLAPCPLPRRLAQDRLRRARSLRSSSARPSLAEASWSTPRRLLMAPGLKPTPTRMPRCWDPCAPAALELGATLWSNGPRLRESSSRNTRALPKGGSRRPCSQRRHLRL